MQTKLYDVRRGQLSLSALAVTMKRFRRAFQTRRHANLNANASRSRKLELLDAIEEAFASVAFVIGKDECLKLYLAKPRSSVLRLGCAFFCIGYMKPALNSATSWSGRR